VRADLPGIAVAEPDQCQGEVAPLRAQPAIAVADLDLSTVDEPGTPLAEPESLAFLLQPGAELDQFDDLGIDLRDAVHEVLDGLRGHAPTAISRGREVAR
jgi:hypothetical protein